MSAGFDIDYALVERTSAQLDQARALLVRATSTVQMTVDDTGNPWGADQQGSAFAEVYTQTLDHVLGVMRTHADQLDYAASSLRQSAADHRDNDNNVRVVFDGLGTSLGTTSKAERT